MITNGSFLYVLLPGTYVSHAIADLLSKIFKQDFEKFPAMGKFINNLTSTVAIALLLTILSDGALVNRTIDDNNLNNLNVTNVTYIGRWIHSTDCGDLTTQTVDACSQTIDSSRVLDHTWTGTVYNGPDIRLYPTLSLAFNGKFLLSLVLFNQHYSLF